jgi:hypothetical protein
VSGAMTKVRATTAAATVIAIDLLICIGRLRTGSEERPGSLCRFRGGPGRTVHRSITFGSPAVVGGAWQRFR